MSWKEFIEKLGLTWMWLITLLMTYTFYIAYFTEAKAVTIYVNAIGEANIEAFILIPMLIIGGSIAYIMLMKK